MSADFSEKNRNRMIARNQDPVAFRQGRRNRAAFAFHGAFGNEPVRVYNDCAMGTSAPQRLDKRSAKEHDEREDYDGS